MRTSYQVLQSGSDNVWSLRLVGASQRHTSPGRWLAAFDTGPCQLLNIFRFHDRVQNVSCQILSKTATAQDNGGGRRLGTLVVWLDDGIESDKPLLAVPINLSVLLDLPQDQACANAYVGNDLRVVRFVWVIQSRDLPDLSDFPWQVK